MSSGGRDLNRRKLSFLGFNTRDGDGHDPDAVELDDEMERVFADADTKFDISKLADNPNPNVCDEKYYDAHRKDSFPASGGYKPKSSLKYPESPDVNVTSPETISPSSPAIQILQLSSEEPQLSLPRPLAGHLLDNASSDTKHVAFNKGTADQSSSDSEDNRSIHKNRRQGKDFQKPRKYASQEHGSFKNERTISIQPEDQTLKEVDIDDLVSHRSDFSHGPRRSKLQYVSPPLSDKNGPLKANRLNRKAIDHSPHEIFVQLDELVGVGDEREWKETARWIKYEEDLEEGAGRWGRPHVGALSFHSLLNLRRCLETGVVLLDIEEKDIASIAYRIVEQMAIDDLITEDEKPTVMRSLLLKHRHVDEHNHGAFPFVRRRNSSYASLQGLQEGIFNSRRASESVTPQSPLSAISGSGSFINTSPSITKIPITAQKRRQSSFPKLINLNTDEKKPKITSINELVGTNNESQAVIDIKEETYSSSQEDLKRAAHDTIFKRIPEGAEATTVLVGAVDFLDQPTIAFVRLSEGTLLPSITEVPVPVRFLFVLLGPTSADLDYHEVGRSIATLMSSEDFHNIAYKAQERRDLLSAINDFLDDSIVLPPGDWENQNVLPFDELKAKKEMIRRRKKKALDAKAHASKDKQQILEEEKTLLTPCYDDDKPPKKPTKDPLVRTHRLWGGVINDIKRRYPMYKSDIMDGLNTETLAATIFMYFAALSTAITFGGLASDKTFNLIGISETLISASMVGVVFHLLCGQPLVIIGTTGPLLLFDEALYQFCLANNYDFLSVRVYIGMWLVVIAMAVSALEGSVLVRLFTRFTQEIFSALITLIYLVETITKLIYVYGRHPLLHQYNYKNTTEIIVTSVPNITEASLDSTDVLTNISENFLSLMNLTANNTEIMEDMNHVDNNNTILLQSSDEIGPLNQPNTALFCTILTLGTFTLAYTLKLFRNWHFLGRTARRALGDFGVPISIAIFVLIDYNLPQVFTDKLTVPEGISPSDPSRRGWLIPMGGVPNWLPFVAGIPAILVYILVFMETHISELIVDKPERGLKKGSGLHMDIVLLCFLNMVCGFFGMPWHCAATVRSVTHVSAVTIMSRTHAPGSNPHVIDVKEQRISGFIVSLLVGLSVTMAPLLRLIPMSVLFGVFFYMGIASMLGVQFFERVRLLFMPVKHHPPTPFVRRVQTWKMHVFTLIQILSLALLWAVKSSKFSLAFPFFLILMVPLRQKLANYYTEKELKALDGSQANADEDEPDFYEQSALPA